MDRWISSISITSLILVFGFFLLAALVNYFGQVNLQTARDLSIKTAELIIELKSIVSTMKDCETGQRGYIITGDASYLEPYEECHSKLLGMIDHVDKFKPGDEEFHAKLKKLKQLCESKLFELNKSLEARRNSGFEAAQRIVQTNRGKSVMDQIRALINDMVNKETSVLEHRQKSLTEQFNAGTLCAISLVLVGCALTAGTFLLIGHLVTNREKEISIMNAQYDITQTLADSPEVNDSISLVLGMICRELDWDLGAFWSYDPDKQALHCVTLWCAPEFEAPEFRSKTLSLSMPVGFGLPGRTLENQEILWIGDVVDLPARIESAMKENIRTGVGVPITLGSEKIGVIEFFSTTKKKKNAETLRFMSALGNQIAQSVQRHQAQQSLIERELTLSTILDTAAEGIFSLSADGIIESVNLAICNMFSCHPADLVNENVSVILPKLLEVTNELMRANEKSGEGARGAKIELVGVRLDGSEFPAEIAYSITNLRENKIITGIVSDITERKIMERRVSEFYSTVSHELRTPLTSIRGSLSLLDGGRAGELSVRAHQLIKVARSESERLIRLINDILDIKKLESGKLELKMEYVEIVALVKQTVEALYGYAQQSGIKLNLQINAVGEIYCDKDRIDQVLTNLIANAIKFSNVGEEVLIEVDKTKSAAWRFSIIDHGPGIQDVETPKLFKLFQQLDPSDSRRKGGTGLGLSICKSLVEKHQGSIGLESKVGEGSTFWFEIPNLSQIIDAPVLEKMPPLLYRGKKTVLIVEDDLKLANRLLATLEAQNCIAIKCSTIKEAEKYLLNNRSPDAMILDLSLPDGAGLELMDSLEHNDQASIPIIILSARESDLNNYPYPLLVDWIKKPFVEQQLLSALAVAIKTRNKGQAKVLIVEDDQPTREVIRQNLESLNVDFIEAADGITAVHVIRSENPDLIVLDLGLPSLDGFEVVEILRKEKMQDIKLIVYTAKDLTESEKKELTLGLTSHMVKSRTSEEELLETVKTMLSGLLDQNTTRV